MTLSFWIVNLNVADKAKRGMLKFRKHSIPNAEEGPNDTLGLPNLPSAMTLGLRSLGSHMAPTHSFYSAALASTHLSRPYSNSSARLPQRRILNVTKGQTYKASFFFLSGQKKTSRGLFPFTTSYGRCTPPRLTLLRLFR